MKRSKQVFLITTVLVLAAGVVLGRLSSRLPEDHFPPHKQPLWVRQLGLSAEQQKQMDAIWADTRKKIDENHEAADQHRQELQQQRDDAVHKLLSPEQRSAYDKIMDDYRNKRSELDKQRDAVIHSAEERSRALLDDSQKTKWDSLQKEMHSHHGPHGPGGPGGGPRGAGPSSQRWDHSPDTGLDRPDMHRG